MKRFCMINYNETICHPYYVFANNVESVYQYMFDNEMISYNFEGIDKTTYTIEDIYLVFKSIQKSKVSSYKSSIFEVSSDAGVVIPEQKLRWEIEQTKPVVLDYEDLESSRQKDLDLTVQYIRNIELKRNAFERFKEMQHFEESIEKFKKMKKMKV